MLDYIADRMEWTDVQCHSVNYNAVGIAKKRLPEHESVQISKLMHGWLNLGDQKEKMGGDPLCPCCGKTTEDIAHLYRCKNTEMTKTFVAQMRLMEASLIKDRVPTPVIKGFMGLVHQAAHRTPSSYLGTDSAPVHTAVESQETLGMMPILLGYHHKQWLNAITTLWQPPAANRDGKQPKSKLPNELAASLVTQVWRLFRAMWLKRNEILHSPESALIERVDQKCTDAFLNFKRNATIWLRSTDRFMTDYPLGEFLSWPRTKRRTLLKTLERLKKVHNNETSSSLLRQRRIDTFFDIRIPPDIAESDSSFEPSVTDTSTSTEYTAITSDLNGDTLLSFELLSDSAFSAGDLSSDDGSMSSAASLIGWDTV
jgi:hypothetical protein